MLAEINKISKGSRRLYRSKQISKSDVNVQKLDLVELNEQESKLFYDIVNNYKTKMQDPVYQNSANRHCCIQ